MDKKLPIFLRGDYWYCYVRTPSGKRLQRALHIRNDGSRESYRAAVAAYWQEQARATSGALDQPAQPRVTLGEALAKLAAIQALAELSEFRHRTVYRCSKHLLDHFKADFDLMKLTKTADYVEYATKARAARQAVTVRQELGVLAQAMRAIGLNAPKLPKLGGLKYKPQQPLTPDEMRRFYLAVKPKYKLPIMTVACLGLRTSEYRKIDIIEWNIQMVHVEGTKTGKSKRWIPVPDELWEVMTGMRARGEWNGFPRVSDKMIDVTIRNACIRAGIGPRSVNDLRGTYSTALALAGVSAADRAALQGNSELMQVQTYSQPHLRPEELRPSVAKLPRITRPSSSNGLASTTPAEAANTGDVSGSHNAE